MTKRQLMLALGLAAMLAGGAAEAADVSVGSSLFSQGRSRVSITGGTAQSFSQSYFVLGLGAGYYVAPGLELGLDGEAWLGASPSIYQVSPGIRYIYTGTRSLWPYLGAFYRRTFYEDQEDLDSAGGRAGVYSPLGGRAWAAFGAVYESWFDCDDNVYETCSDLRPEISFGVSF